MIRSSIFALGISFVVSAGFAIASDKPFDVVNNGSITSEELPAHGKQPMGMTIVLSCDGSTPRITFKFPVADSTVPAPVGPNGPAETVSLHFRKLSFMSSITAWFDRQATYAIEGKLEDDELPGEPLVYQSIVVKGPVALRISSDLSSFDIVVVSASNLRREFGFDINQVGPFRTGAQQALSSCSSN